MAKIETFTGVVRRNGQEPRQQANMTILPGGYVGIVHSVGRGKMTEMGGRNSYGEGETWEEYEYYEDAVAPLFDRLKCIEAGMLEKIMAIKGGAQLSDVQKNDWWGLLLKFGQQDGYAIANADQETQEKFESEKKVYFRIHNCWETGINWYELSTHRGRYPKHVFDALKSAGMTYHAEQEEEEGHWKGWCFTHNLEDAAKALIPTGWSIN